MIHMVQISSPDVNYSSIQASALAVEFSVHSLFSLKHSTGEDCFFVFFLFFNYYKGVSK